MKNNGSTLIKENRVNSLYTKKWFGVLLQNK